MMKKWIAAMFVCLLALPCGAMAAGTTLRVFTPFADVDFAAQAYMDMITQWEAETGNIVEDYSGVMDEAFMEQLAQMLDSGAADVVVLPVGSGFTVSGLVTVNELIGAAPDIGAKRFESMKEADGSVLLAPIRLNWEALYVNKDVLDRFGLPLPATFEQLLAACAVLSQSGVMPIANALCEWSEIVLDCAALSGAPQAQYGQQASLDGAKDVLTILTQVGAFGPNPWNMSDAEAEAAFLAGEAAMRIDADGLAQMVSYARQDSVVVLPLPPKDSVARSASVGTPAFGVAVSRACWQDDVRSEAAVSLIETMLSESGLAAPAGGKLGESIAQLTKNAQDCTGLLYDLNPDGFDAWSESVIAQLMSL